MDINLIIEKIKNELKISYPDFRGIYSYGSQVKGYARQDSDYDLVFVFDREIDWKFKEEIIEYVYKYEVENCIIIDVKVYSVQQLNEVEIPFRRNVINDGVFYAAEV